MKIKDHLESDGSILTRGIREWSREDRWPYGCLSRARYDLHSSCKRGLWHRPESEVPRRRTLVTKPSWGLSARRVRLCCSCDKSIEHPVLHGTPSTILTPHRRRITFGNLQVERSAAAAHFHRIRLHARAHRSWSLTSLTRPRPILPNMPSARDWRKQSAATTASTLASTRAWQKHAPIKTIDDDLVATHLEQTRQAMHPVQTEEIGGVG